MKAQNKKEPVKKQKNSELKNELLNLRKELDELNSVERRKKLEFLIKIGKIDEEIIFFEMEKKRKIIKRIKEIEKGLN